MASRIPPHVTLVYPEETVDKSLLFDRVAQGADATAPFKVSIADLQGGDCTDARGARASDQSLGRPVSTKGWDTTPSSIYPW
jgi:hypothetical protein